MFVRSNTQGGRIYNLSPDVVSGTVTRNVNDLSTAEVVLRNRFRKWLKDPENGMSILMPMDMITIWLQRIAGKPIQVFTGYLDSVPYYQMYPGNCTITATCTLKRLSYSWFDPGLEWFQNWFNTIGGWKIINPETGEIQNTSALQLTDNQNKMKINDGGFADLIQRFMTDIAGWSPDNIIISDLPANIPKIAAGLYNRVQKENAISQQALEELMANIIGITASPITSQTQDPKSSQQQGIMGNVKQVASAKNIPLIIPVTASLLTTGFKAAYAKHEDRAKNKDDWGYGMYAMKPKVTLQHDHRTSQTIVTEGNTINGVDKQKLTNPTTATEVFLKLMQRINVSPPGGRGPAKKYDAALQKDQAVMQAWIENALNRKFTSDQWSAAHSQAKLMISTFAHPASALPAGSTGVSTPAGLTWAGVSQMNTVMDSHDSSVYHKRYTKANDSLAPYYWMAKTNFSGIHLQNPDTGATSVMVLGGSSTDLESFFDGVKHHSEYDTITLSKTSGSRIQLTTFKNGKKTGVSTIPAGPSGVTGSTVTMQVSAGATYPAWTFSTTTGSNTTTGSSDVTAGGLNTGTANQFKVEDIGKIGFASAFLAHYTLSANWMESEFLTGYKALANDQSCMDGVKQFCQSSLRSFMSLPDGKFCAFYPDYFGAHGRKPYWYIYDIEITNGGVMLSDEQLATHVYTIGDTFGNDEVIDQFDYIRSAGVVTMDMGILEGFIRPLQTQESSSKFGKGQGADNLGVIKTTADFVYHYGARPYKEEVPMIRNQFFEFLYAWQRFMQKWAATFQTTVEFTFQPEVMCGGIIGFPQHNLQMYCEQVTHTLGLLFGFHHERDPL